jgi:hypothetical protein
MASCVQRSIGWSSLVPPHNRMKTAIERAPPAASCLWPNEVYRSKDIRWACEVVVHTWERELKRLGPLSC